MNNTLEKFAALKENHKNPFKQEKFQFETDINNLVFTFETLRVIFVKTLHQIKIFKRFSLKIFFKVKNLTQPHI